MRGEEKLLDLVGRIYDAGVGARAWADCLGHIAAMLRSRTAVVQVTDLAKCSLVRMDHVDVEEGAIEEYSNYYIRISPRIEFGLTKPFGYIFSDYEFISESEMDKHEFYADFLAKWDFRYFAAAAFPVVPGLLGHFAIQRTSLEGHVDEEQIHLLKSLFPHVRRAMELEWRLNRTRQERDGAVDVLDQLAYAVILVTDSAEVVRANRAGDRILSGQKGLRVTDGALCAATQKDTDRLHSLIGRAAQTTLREDLDPGGVLLIARPSMQRPLSVSVLPLGNHPELRASSYGPRAAALVFVHDPETSTAVSSEILQLYYGLTPAEARLAKALATGAHLKSAAEQFGISPETARTQLKAVLGKTGTHAQSDLIRLILSGPAVIGRL